MKFKQVLFRCEEKGINITREGLYLAGLKNGFIERDVDHINIFHKEKFEIWIAKKLEKAPEGFYSFSECSKKLNVPLNTIYHIINESDLEIKTIGTKGVKYVKLEDLEKYIRFRKYGSEEKYGN